MYDKPRSRNEKDSIVLKNMITCKEGNVKELKKKFTFEMKDKSGPRTYFQCKNTEEVQEWMGIIGLCCESGDFWTGEGRKSVIDFRNLHIKPPSKSGSSKGPPPAASSGAAVGGGATAATKAASVTIQNSYSTRHTTEPWYVAKMGRDDCKRAVTSGDPGDFLVRDSSDGKKMVIVLNGRGPGETANYQIVPGDNYMYIVSGVPYRHVAEVLQSMRDNHPNGNDGKSLPLANVANYGQGGGRERSDTTTTYDMATCSMCGCFTEAWPCDICGADAPSNGAASKPPPAAGPHVGYMGEDLHHQVKGQHIYIAPLNEEQFEMLDPRETFPEELPAYCRNMDHNRYWDILPNGITRVKLVVENDDQSTDYVNANWVRGYGVSGAKKYIAAQGPLGTSLERFIRMIWECNVLTIVMITGLVEAGKVKCERYWPEDEDEPMQIGRYVVTLLGTEYEDGYRFHDLEVTAPNGDKKELRHYWFDSWPDHGVPENSLGEFYPDNALHMLTSARTEQRRLAEFGHGEAPLLVHCSAGIGRTGTFITIDHAMDAIKSQSKVDMNDIVLHIRQDRMGMIQHTSQYKFAYQASVNYALTVFPDAGIFTEAANSSSAPFSEKLKADSMRKNGTWKISALGDASTTYQMRSNAPSLRTATSDREIFTPAEGGQPAAARPPSPEMRKRMTLKPLQKQSWFRTKFSREQVNELLGDAPVGTFICRESSQKGMFAISVQQGGHISNVLCMPEQGRDPRSGSVVNMFKFGDRGDILFPTIPLMIEHFMVNPYTQHPSTGELLILRPPNAMGKLDHIAKRVQTDASGKANSLLIGAGFEQSDQ